MHAFARKLGIDPAIDSHLLWICEAAFTVTLPAGWAKQRQADGSMLYYHHTTAVWTAAHPQVRENGPEPC
jgi:hypothetical protein